MGRRFLVAGVFAAVVAVIGVLIWQIALSPDATGSEEQAVNQPRVRSNPDAAAKKKPAAPRTATIAQVSGTVERSTDGDTWVAAIAGDELALDERIRTGPDASATLDIAGRAKVDLAANSLFSVREISETLSRVILDQGRASAVVDDKRKSTLRMEFRGTKTVAESKGGAFSAVSSGKGEVTVAATKGKVRLSGEHDEVEVPENMQSSIFGNAPPSKPIIPPSLYLKVKRPGRRTQRRKTATVRGSATPGALISVNGVRFSADAAGSFNATVALNEGKNVLLVEAETVTGKRQQKQIPIVVKSRVRRLEGTTTWGAPKKPK